MPRCAKGGDGERGSRTNKARKKSRRRRDDSTCGARRAPNRSNTVWTAQNYAINAIGEGAEQTLTTTHLLPRPTSSPVERTWVRTRCGTGAAPPCCFSRGEKGVKKPVLCYQYERWRRRADLAAAADALGWWRCIAAEMAELCPNLAEMAELSASSSQFCPRVAAQAKSSPLHRVDLGGEISNFADILA